MFRLPRVLLVVLAVLIATLCTAVYAQDLFGSKPSGPAVRPAQPAPPMNELQKHFAAAIQFMRQHKVDQAIAELLAAKKMQPKQPAILMNLSICYAQKRNFAAAEEACREVIALDLKGTAPTTKPAAGQLVQLLMAEGKTSQAIATVKKLVAMSPKDFGPRFMLGICYVRDKDYASAAGAFKSALAIKPNDPGATQNLAVSYFYSKNYPEARKVFEKMLKTKDDPQVRAMAGFACEQMGDKTAALAQYDKLAWKRVPQSPPAVMSMVHMYTAMNKPAEAAKVLKKAASIYKNDYGINSELGREFIVEKKYKEAESYLLAAQKVKSSPVSNFNLALVEANLGKLDAAKTYCLAGLKQDPKNRQGLDLYAYALNAAHKNDEAIAQYRKWEQYYPKDPSANVKIAGLYSMQNKYDLASKEYQKAISKAPKDVDIMVSASEVLKAWGKHDDAIALLQKAILIDQKNIAPRVALAGVYDDVNKVDLEIEQIKKIIAIEPSPQAYMRLAAAYDRNKDYTNEADAYREICKLDPKDIRSAVEVARVLDKGGQTDGALAEAKKVSEANPKNEQARACYGDILVKKQDYTGAITQYTELTKSASAGVKGYGYCKIGDVQEKQGKHDDAIASYKSSLDASPSSPDALDALAKIYDDQKKPEEFLAFLKTKVETGKDDAPYDCFIAKSKAANKADDAVKSLEAAAAKSKDSKTVHLQLIEAYKAAGQYDKAIEQYKAMLAKSKDDIMIEISLADVYRTANKDQEAINTLKDLAKKIPNYTKIHVDLGDMYAKLGNKTDAEASYNTALKQQPNNVEVQNKLKALTAPPAPTTAPAPGPAVAPAPAAAPSASPAPASAPSPTPGAAPAVK